MKEMMRNKICICLKTMVLILFAIVLFLPQDVKADTSDWEAAYKNGIRVSFNEIQLYEGESFQLYIGKYYGDVIFSSSDNEIVSVSNEGLITAKKIGNARIMVISKNYGEDYCDVSVCEDKDYSVGNVSSYGHITQDVEKITSNEKYNLTVDRGIYIQNNFESILEDIIDNIEIVTGMTFFPEGANCKKIEIEAINAKNIEPFGDYEGIQLDPLACGLEGTGELYCLVHELIHTIQRRNIGGNNRILAEGHSEIHVDEVLRRLGYAGDSEHYRMFDYKWYWDETYNFKEVEYTESNIENIILTTTDIHGVSYFLAKYIQLTYGDSTLYDIMKECSNTQHTGREAELAIIKSYTANTFCEDFIKWYNSYNGWPLENVSDYTSVSKIDAVMPTLLWKTNPFMIMYNNSLVYKNSLEVDYTKAISYAQEYMGLKFKGINITLRGQETTAIFYDKNNNILNTIELDNSQMKNYFVGKAVKIKFVGSGVKQVFIDNLDGDDFAIEIPDQGHTYSTKWSMDTDYHWHASTCGHENEIKDKAAHIYDMGVVTKEATIDSEGVKTYSCIVCGQTKAVVIPKKTATSTGSDENKSDASEAQKKNQEVKDKSDNVYEVVDSNKKQVSFKSLASTTVKKVKIPSTVEIGGVKYKVVSIEENAFKNNKKITKVTIPSSIVSIGDKAFAGCSRLTTITIPKNVTSIGSNVFSGCKKLKIIIINTRKLTDKTVEKNAFKNLSKDTTIVIPKKNEKKYKALLKKKGFKGTIKVSS